MDALEDLDTVVEVITEVNIPLHDLTFTDTEQGLFGPLTEPIKRTARDE